MADDNPQYMKGSVAPNQSSTNVWLLNTVHLDLPVPLNMFDVFFVWIKTLVPFSVHIKIAIENGHL